MEDTNTEIKLKENENKDSNLIKIQLEETKSNKFTIYLNNSNF